MASLRLFKRQSREVLQATVKVHPEYVVGTGSVLVTNFKVPPLKGTALLWMSKL